MTTLRTFGPAALSSEPPAVTSRGNKTKSNPATESSVSTADSTEQHDKDAYERSVSLALVHSHLVENGLTNIGSDEMMLNQIAAACSTSTGNLIVKIPEHCWNVGLARLIPYVSGRVTFKSSPDVKWTGDHDLLRALREAAGAFIFNLVDRPSRKVIELGGNFAANILHHRHHVHTCSAVFMQDSPYAGSDTRRFIDALRSLRNSLQKFPRTSFGFLQKADTKHTVSLTMGVLKEVLEATQPCLVEALLRKLGIRKTDNFCFRFQQPSQVKRLVTALQAPNAGQGLLDDQQMQHSFLGGCCFEGIEKCVQSCETIVAMDSVYEMHIEDFCVNMATHGATDAFVSMIYAPDILVRSFQRWEGILDVDVTSNYLRVPTGRGLRDERNFDNGNLTYHSRSDLRVCFKPDGHSSGYIHPYETVISWYYHRPTITVTVWTDNKGHYSRDARPGFFKPVTLYYQCEITQVFGPVAVFRLCLAGPIDNRTTTVRFSQGPKAVSGTIAVMCPHLDYDHQGISVSYIVHYLDIPQWTNCLSMFQGSKTQDLSSMLTQLSRYFVTSFSVVATDGSSGTIIEKRRHNTSWETILDLSLAAVAIHLRTHSSTVQHLMQLIRNDKEVKEGVGMLRPLLWWCGEKIRSIFPRIAEWWDLRKFEWNSLVVAYLETILQVHTWTLPSAVSIPQEGKVLWQFSESNTRKNETCGYDCTPHISERCRIRLPALFCEKMGTRLGKAVNLEDMYNFTAEQATAGLENGEHAQICALVQKLRSLPSQLNAEQVASLNSLGLEHLYDDEGKLDKPAIFRRPVDTESPEEIQIEEGDMPSISESNVGMLPAAGCGHPNPTHICNTDNGMTICSACLDNHRGHSILSLPHVSAASSFVNISAVERPPVADEAHVVREFPTAVKVPVVSPISVSVASTASSELSFPVARPVSKRLLDASSDVDESLPVPVPTLR